MVSNINTIGAVEFLPNMSKKNRFFRSLRCWKSDRFAVGSQTALRAVGGRELWEVNGVFVAEVTDDMRREEFRCGSDAICFEKSSVGLEPTAESGERNARRCGELGFGITVHS